MKTDRYPSVQYGKEDLTDRKRISRFLVKNEVEFSPTNHTNKEFEAYILVKNTPKSYSKNYYSPPKTSHINYNYIDKTPDYIKNPPKPVSRVKSGVRSRLFDYERHLGANRSKYQASDFDDIRSKSQMDYQNAKDKLKAEQKDAKKKKKKKGSKNDSRSKSRNSSNSDNGSVDFNTSKRKERKMLNDVLNAYDQRDDDSDPYRSKEYPESKKILNDSKDSFLLDSNPSRSRSRNDGERGDETPRLGGSRQRGLSTNPSGGRGRKSVLDDLPVGADPESRKGMLADIKGFKRDTLKHANTVQPNGNRGSMLSEIKNFNRSSLRASVLEAKGIFVPPGSTKKELKRLQSKHKKSEKKKLKKQKKEEKKKARKEKNRLRKEQGLAPEPESESSESEASSESEDSDSDEDDQKETNATNTPTPAKDAKDIEALRAKKMAKIADKKNKYQIKKREKQLKKEKKKREKAERNQLRAARGLAAEPDSSSSEESDDEDEDEDDESSSEEEVEEDEVDEIGLRTGNVITVKRKKVKSSIPGKSKAKKKVKSKDDGLKKWNQRIDTDDLLNSSSSSSSSESDSSSDSDNVDSEDEYYDNDTAEMMAIKRKRRAAKKKAKKEKKKLKEKKKEQKKKEKKQKQEVKRKEKLMKKQAQQRGLMQGELKGLVFGEKKEKGSHQPHNEQSPKKKKKNTEGEVYDDLAKAIRSKKSKERDHDDSDESDNDDRSPSRHSKSPSNSKFKTPTKKGKPLNARQKAEEYYQKLKETKAKELSRSKSANKNKSPTMTPTKKDKYKPAEQKHRMKSSQSKRKKDTSPKQAASPENHKYTKYHNQMRDLTYTPIGKKKEEKKETTRQRLDDFQKFYNSKIEQLNSNFSNKVKETFKDIIDEDELNDKYPHHNRNFIFKYGPWELDKLKMALRRNVESGYNEHSKNILDAAKDYEQRMEAFLFKDKPYFNEQTTFDELCLTTPQKVFYHKVVQERTRLRSTQKVRNYFEGKY